jgi:membrane-associated phospholipid phosphatase
MALKARIGIGALATVLFAATAGARYWAYFPGDVAVTRFIQGITPASTDWALWVTATAKSPWCLVLLAITVGLSWKLSGWRAALLALVSYAGMWLLGNWLGPLITRPRPTPDLVRVAQKLPGYSFPSTFALVYASTVGFLAVLFATRTSGRLRAVSLSICCALLLTGWVARIVLGAHWPSDILLSYLIGLLWAYFLTRWA